MIVDLRVNGGTDHSRGLTGPDLEGQLGLEGSSARFGAARDLTLADFTSSPRCAAQVRTTPWVERAHGASPAHLRHGGGAATQAGGQGHRYWCPEQSRRPWRAGHPHRQGRRAVRPGCARAPPQRRRPAVRAQRRQARPARAGPAAVARLRARGAVSTSPRASRFPGPGREAGTARYE